VRLGTFLVVVTAFALWDGADPNVALTFVLVGIFSYLLTEKRMNLMRSLLQEVLEHREQLHVAYQRAMEQEKLSSLGMMPAGVAHEINNPMSFVTSNISSLYRELKEQPSVPEPFREYVDDVLPATLDGIRRVNAIVGDLRRFARGDAEVYVEYDLNIEVQAALRIAHSQLSHCHVETELGEVGPLTGRPRQIVQALVNVLVNAGQATASGGRVHLSTRREGEWVRVAVRDTGTGIPPEVMRNLFQPFFTTKPQGAGMGLGLAVSHGIITAHGGRIEVDTAPGQGSCFTLHLPRVPRQPGTPDPLPLHRANDAEGPKA
jgi:two-component system NtrC family sensor kinase